MLITILAVVEIPGADERPDDELVDDVTSMFDTTATCHFVSVARGVSEAALAAGCDADGIAFDACGADLSPLGTGTAPCVLPSGHDNGCKVSSSKSKKETSHA